MLATIHVASIVNAPRLAERRTQQVSSLADGERRMVGVPGKSMSRIYLSCNIIYCKSGTIEGLLICLPLFNLIRYLNGKIGERWAAAHENQKG